MPCCYRLRSWSRLIAPSTWCRPRMRWPRCARPLGSVSPGPAMASRSARWRSPIARPTLYRPLVESVFSEAGLPVYLDDGPSLAERPLGRRILALLDLVGTDITRRDLMSFLSDGWLPKETRERFDGAPTARWDSASRRAGVVAGIDQWRTRLRLLNEKERRGGRAAGRPGVVGTARR